MVGVIHLLKDYAFQEAASRLERLDGLRWLPLAAFIQQLVYLRKLLKLRRTRAQQPGHYLVQRSNWKLA